MYKSDEWSWDYCSAYCSMSRYWGRAGFKPSPDNHFHQVLGLHTTIHFRPSSGAAWVVPAWRHTRQGSHLPKTGTSRAITSGNHSPLAIWCGSAGKWSSQGSRALNAMQPPSEAAAKGPKLSWWAPRRGKFSFHYINWATLWAETTSPCLPTKDKAPAPV